MAVCPMPRGKPKKQAEVKANAFIQALQFVSLVARDVGPVNETHIHIHNGWITAFNGVLGAGHKIAEDLHASPSAKLITQALLKCSGHFDITQLDNNQLSIKIGQIQSYCPLC
jgi:hypothetical protein